MQLPHQLRAAIGEELSAWSAKRLSPSVAALSKRYRAGQTDGADRFVRSPEDVAAYAAFRVPGTFAAVYAALGQVHEQLTEWSPRSLLDVGAGPGTAMWAATHMFPQLRDVTLLERERSMITLGERLASHSVHTAVRRATWVRVDVTSTWDASPHDLVIASYVLGELSQSSRSALVLKLWTMTNGTLLLIEPGTPVGFGHVKEARSALVDAGAQTIAPCPHNDVCPMAGSDWCHFAQRVERSRIHRQVKEGELSYEDEKFSFVGVSRSPGTPITGRVVRHPLIRKGQVGLQVCTPEGIIESMNVTRKDRAQFRKARNLRWGSAMPSPDGQKA